MLLHKPHLILAHLGRAREILENNESRVPVTLSILWVLSQPAFKDARIGVQGNQFISLNYINIFFSQ